MQCLGYPHAVSVFLNRCICWRLRAGSAALVVLNLSQPGASAEGMLHGMNAASHAIDTWIVVIFGAVGCLVTGFVYSIFTPWGFFRHGWITWKWVLTIAAILSGTFFLGVWEQAMLDMSGKFGSAVFHAAEYADIRSRHLILSCVQVAGLLLMVWLSVFKPRLRKTATPPKDSTAVQND